MQSHCHLAIMHGSGAGSLKPQIFGAAVGASMTEPLHADLLKDLRDLGKPPVFDVFTFRIHMSLVSALSHVHGQVRSRTESDHFGSRESAGRSTSEILHADVLHVGFDHETKCPNPCPSCSRIQRSRGMASDTQQIRPRHKESSGCFDAEDHDACETRV